MRHRCLDWGIKNWEEPWFSVHVLYLYCPWVMLQESSTNSLILRHPCSYREPRPAVKSLIQYWVLKTLAFLWHSSKEFLEDRTVSFHAKDWKSLLELSEAQNGKDLKYQYSWFQRKLHNQITLQRRQTQTICRRLLSAF